MTSSNIAIRNDVSGLALFGAEAEQIMTAGKLLLFKKGKFYIAGAEFNPGSRSFLANPVDGATTGWTKWQDGKPVDHRFVRVIDYAQRISREELGDLDRNAWPTNDRGEPADPWQPSDRLVIRTVDSCEQLLTFTTSSRGGRTALANLMGKVAKSVHYLDESKYPVIQLVSSSYEHDSYGTVHVPEFHIVGWDHWNREWDQTEVDQVKRAADVLDDNIPF